MRRAVRAALAATVLALTAAPVRAEGNPEDVRLRGRGWGYFVAAFWNKTDNTTRRVIVVGGCLLLTAGVAVGVTRFVRETRQAMAPRPRQPWEVE